MFIRLPAEALLSYTQSFADDPQKYSLKIKHLADQEGYGFVKCTLDFLMQETKGKALTYVVLLRQPEWIWRQNMRSLPQKVFGFIEEGSFKAWGHYVIGPHENGQIIVYTECQETVTSTDEEEDPRKGYLFRRTLFGLSSLRQLIFRGLARLKNGAKSVINLLL